MKKLSRFEKYLVLRSRYGSVILEAIDKDQIIEIVEEPSLKLANWQQQRSNYSIKAFKEWVEQFKKK